MITKYYWRKMKNTMQDFFDNDQCSSDGVILIARSYLTAAERSRIDKAQTPINKIPINEYVHGIVDSCVMIAQKGREAKVAGLLKRPVIGLYESLIRAPIAIVYTMNGKIAFFNARKLSMILQVAERNELKLTMFERDVPLVASCNGIDGPNFVACIMPIALLDADHYKLESLILKQLGIKRSKPRKRYPSWLKPYRRQR